MPQSFDYPPHNSTTITSGQSSVITLADAGTVTAPEVHTVQHTTSGTAAAGFGAAQSVDLESGGGTTRRVSTDTISLTTATNGAEVAKRVLSLMIGGTLTDMVAFNTGNGTPIEILTRDGTTNNAITLSQAGDQRIGKSGSGDFYLTSGTNQLIVLATNGTVVFGSKNGLIQFFGAGAPVGQQTGPVLNITNNVTVGGTNGTVANYTDLVTYANDAAAIRNNIYQLARGLKFVSDALRAYQLIT